MLHYLRPTKWHHVVQIALFSLVGFFIIFFVILPHKAFDSSLNTSLISYWKLDEISGTRADSVGANNLGDNNLVTQAVGKLGNAGHFASSSSQYLSIADNASLSTGNTDFTISLWVYLDTKGASEVFVSKYSSVAPVGEYAIYYDPTTDRFIFSTFRSGVQYDAVANSLGSPATGTWYFLVATHSSSANTNTLRINDTYTNTVTSVEHSDSTAPFEIGRFITRTDFYTNGRIDSVGFWKRTLTAAEITQLYSSGSGQEYPFADTSPPAISAVASSTTSTTATIAWTTDEVATSTVNYGTTTSYGSASSSGAFVTSHSITLTGLTATTSYHFKISSADSTGNLATSSDYTLTTASASSLTTSLISYWKLGEASGARADSMGTNNLTEHGTGGVGQTSGQLGNAALFASSSSQYLDIADNASLSTGSTNFTVSLWVKTAGNCSATSVFVSKYGGVTGEYAIYCFSGAFYFSTYSAGTHSAIATALGQPVIGTWYHLVATHNATTHTNTIRINDTYENSVSGATEHVDSTGAFNIGRFTSGSFYWGGAVDAVGFWKRLLTSAEITQLYNSGSGLEYPFDGGAVLDTTAPVISSIASSTSARHATVTWTSDEGADSKVAYGVSSGTYNTSTSSVPSVSSHSITLTSLSPSTLYYYVVVSADASGNIATSTEKILTTTAILTYLNILSTGQSLSLGYYATPAISTTQPYSNLMLTGGVEGTAAPLIVLTEAGLGVAGNVETISSGMANALSTYGAQSRPVIVNLHGSNGTAYSGVKKGTSPYNKGIAQSTTIKSQVENTLDGIYLPVGVTAIHGESDYSAGAGLTYENSLIEWQTDYQNDLNALNSGSATIPLFINQMNAGLTGEVAVAQLNAHKDAPGKVILVGPKYQYHYRSDKLHMDTNTEEKQMGEMLAKAISKVAIESLVWNPLMPTTLERVGNVVTISYRIPVGTLAVDTTVVAARPSYGFEFTQTGGNSVSISSVALINSSSQVQITLSAVPTGTNQHVRYAWSCYSGSGSCAQANSTSSVGGNIRDTDGSVSPSVNGTGLPLYDWGVTFDEPVTADISAPAVSLSAPAGGALVSGTTVTLSADASDNVGVTGVQFKLDTNTNIGSEDTSAPYSLTWNSTAALSGTHTLIAVAHDAAGNYATSSIINVTVDNTPPTPGAITFSNVTAVTITASTTAAAMTRSQSCPMCIATLPTIHIPQQRVRRLSLPALRQAQIIRSRSELQIVQATGQHQQSLR